MFNPKTTEGNDFQDLLNVIGDAAERFGMTRVKWEDIEIEFAEVQTQLVSYTTDVSSTQPIGEEHGMPTEDELLFASSIPLTDDEIRAKAP